MNGQTLLFFITRNDKMHEYIQTNWYAWYCELVNVHDDNKRQYKSLDDFIINDLIDYTIQNERYKSNN